MIEKKEFIKHIEAGKTLGDHEWCYWKYNDLYYYTCENGTCCDIFDNIEELWKWYKRFEQ